MSPSGPIRTMWPHLAATWAREDMRAVFRNSLGVRGLARPHTRQDQTMLVRNLVFALRWGETEVRCEEGGDLDFFVYPGVRGSWAPCTPGHMTTKPPWRLPLSPSDSILLSSTMAPSKAKTKQGAATATPRYWPLLLGIALFSMLVRAAVSLGPYSGDDHGLIWRHSVNARSPASIRLCHAQSHSDLTLYSWPRRVQHTAKVRRL